MELKGKLGQNSVDRLLNNSLIVALCHRQTLSKLTLSEEKCSGETTNQDGHCHGYALFPFSAWTWTTPSLNLNLKTYSTLPRIHVRREIMARGTKEHFNFARAWWMYYMRSCVASLQGGLKNGRRTLKIFWEDWYAREISRFVCNKVPLF